jgi:glutamate-5-semialdehyde dehydrogenase
MDCTPQFRNARKASHTLNVLDSAIIDKMLLSIAEKAIENTEYILTENQKDLALMKESDPRFDRLKLTAERIEGIAEIF